MDLLFDFVDEAGLGGLGDGPLAARGLDALEYVLAVEGGAGAVAFDDDEAVGLLDAFVGGEAFGAFLALSASADRAPIVFLGDDVTDEEAFAMFGPDDVSIRVGPGPSCARFRLPGPAAVVDLLRHLTA